MKTVLIWLITLYRKYISPLTPPCCRFTPAWSAYALEALQKRGLIAGTILAIWRILRCNPFARGGYDPVPEKGFRAYGKGQSEEDIEHPNEEKEI